MQYTNRYQYRKQAIVKASIIDTVKQGARLAGYMFAIWAIVVLYTV